SQVRELRRQVAGRRPVQVGQHQHAVAAIHPSQRRAGLRQQALGIVVERDLEGFRLQRQVAQQLLGHRQQRAADALVRDQQHADHAQRSLTFMSSSRRSSLPLISSSGGLPSVETYAAYSTEGDSTPSAATTVVIRLESSSRRGTSL